jgi:mannose-6-phosphate isomerase-like protein (cupin superfamily)
MERDTIQRLSFRHSRADSQKDDDPAAHGLVWHTHPVPNVAYIVSGHLTVEDQATGKSAIYRAGEAFAEPVGQVHRGRTGNEAAVVLVTYAGIPGIALSQPIPARK